MDGHRGVFPFLVVHPKDTGEETQWQEADRNDREKHDGTALIDTEVRTFERHSGLNYTGLLLLQGKKILKLSMISGISNELVDGDKHTYLLTCAFGRLLQLFNLRPPVKFRS